MNQRKKGHSFELWIVDRLKSMGFEATTSRLTNKKLDWDKVDIDTNFPFNIQAKAVERLSMPAHQILASMPTDKTPVLYHKRNNKGVIVSMRLEDFEELTKQENERQSRGKS